MDLWLAVLVILGAAAVSAAAMLIVRRGAPEGTYFKDPIPAAAVYTVVGTAYMVIVAFVFSSHSRATAAQSPTRRRRRRPRSRCSTPPIPLTRQGEGSEVVDARVTALEES